jgi:glycerol-3-phosphate dehydrogenase
VNYARVVGLGRDGRGKVHEAQIEDVLSDRRFKVHARAFINATGPFSDHIREMAKPGIPHRLRLSKGVHIMLPLDTEDTKDAILIPKTDDGRVIFAIPWLGRFLVGTTDDEATLKDEMIVTKDEAEYLLRHLNRYIVHPLHTDQIVSAIAGVRPLVKSSDALNTKKLIRDHEIEVEPASGLISVLGGKWTTHRAMAEDAVNAVLQHLGEGMVPCRTAHQVLDGAEGYQPEYWQTLVAQYPISPATARHLAEKFGTNAPKVLAIAMEEPRYGSALVEGLAPIQAEVVYGVRFEMAMSIEDVLARRIGLQLFSWKSAMEAAPVVGSLLAGLLNWTSTERQRAVNDYIDKISRLMEKIGLVTHAVMA